jgi:hypothetical protein
VTAIEEEYVKNEALKNFVDKIIGLGGEKLEHLAERIEDVARKLLDAPDEPMRPVNSGHAFLTDGKTTLAETMMQQNS